MTRAALLLALLCIGAGWGFTQPLAKIAVSEGYRGFGIIVWQFAIGVFVLGVITALRGRRLPLGRAPLALYAVVALIGTVLPNAASYQAAVYLPAGIISICISLVPILAFPVALLMRLDRFGWVRFTGLVLGLTGVLMIVVPGSSLPDRAMLAAVPLALIAPLCYAFEGNIVAKWGTFGMDPIQVLLGASVVGILFAVPLAFVTGQWITPPAVFRAPDWAIVVSSAIHAFAYAAYVGMVGRAGPVFAVQVAYLVTGFGVLWAMAILGEAYSGWIWASLALMFAGMFLVQPRKIRRAAAAALVPPGPSANI
ncbi:DMT family transporter [Ostreiculturibacter nitratireducens]|uniref:DMT family transporter n=1 Tax=Ostreiculturibacter nitratireducens TaxID=3075226 RepID=UPI0031B578F0